MDPTFSSTVTAETYVSAMGVSASAESDLTLTGEIGETIGALRSLVFLDGEGDPIGDEHPLKPTVGLH